MFLTRLSRNFWLVLNDVIAGFFWRLFRRLPVLVVIASSAQWPLASKNSGSRSVAEFVGDQCPARGPALTHTAKKKRGSTDEYCRHCKMAVTRIKDYASGAPIVFPPMPADHEVSPYILERRLMALGSYRTRVKLGFLKHLYETDPDAVK